MPLQTSEPRLFSDLWDLRALPAFSALTEGLAEWGALGLGSLTQRLARHANVAPEHGTGGFNPLGVLATALHQFEGGQHLKEEFAGR